MFWNIPSLLEQILRKLIAIDYYLERNDQRMGAFENQVEILDSKIDLLIARQDDGVTQEDLDAAEARAAAAEQLAAEVVEQDASEDAAADQARADALGGLIAKADAALAPAEEEPPVEEPVEEV
jgi:hypothetical protein